MTAAPASPLLSVARTIHRRPDLATDPGCASALAVMECVNLALLQLGIAAELFAMPIGDEECQLRVELTQV